MPFSQARLYLHDVLVGAVLESFVSLARVRLERALSDNLLLTGQKMLND